MLGIIGGYNCISGEPFSFSVSACIDDTKILFITKDYLFQLFNEWNELELEFCRFLGLKISTELNLYDDYNFSEVYIYNFRSMRQ